MEVKSIIETQTTYLDALSSNALAPNGISTHETIVYYFLSTLEQLSMMSFIRQRY